MNGTMKDADIGNMLAEEAEAAEAGAGDDGVLVRNRTRAKDPSQVYSLRIPVDRLEELRRVADETGTAPSALMRRWVLERLDEELERGTDLFEGRTKVPRAYGGGGVFVMTRKQFDAALAGGITEALRTLVKIDEEK